jgi:arylsulfatase A-like enzyme
MTNDQRRYKMGRARSLAYDLLSTVCLFLTVLIPSVALAGPPNIVLVLTDDQGYGDLSCHGNPVLKTPHLDRLFAESVRFTNFHVSPTCAPTRCALLTGRHEFRSGVTHTIFERERMGLEAYNYVQALKELGYANGIFGKWHLGDEDEYQPDRRGFEEVFIHGAGGIGQSYAGSCGDAPGNRYTNPAIWHNGRFVKTKGYCTDLFFNRAMEWIEERKDSGPFYCHIATNTPHTPLDCPPEYERLYADQVSPDEAKFYGMIANIDDNVGRFMQRLRELGLDDNTLVIFMTDNGGTIGVKRYNAGMRGAKVSPWVGGTRASSFWRWKGKFEPGDVDALAAHIDVFPTLTEISGAKPPAEATDKLEGRSLAPLLAHPKADWPDRILVTHVGRWERGKAADAKYRNCSVRNTRFAMVSLARPDGAPAWQLFDLASDPGQQTDVLARFPEAAKELESHYDAWWDSIQSGLVNEDVVGPEVNPFHERYWAQFPEERPPEK